MRSRCSLALTYTKLNFVSGLKRLLSNGDLIISYTKNLSAEGKLVGGDLRVFHSARLLLSAFVAERQPLEQLGDALQNLLQPLLLLEGRAILGRRSDRKLERLQVGKNFLDPETQQTTNILVLVSGCFFTNQT